ncbi:hypothetical protein SDC9_82502 [bioreactor metagenome]|uniref:Uncharacterized protein n=1 Tax=bioreactor metagenome TaxID=1076179 RepID=A0A644Z6J6_9ZZZZ
MEVIKVQTSEVVITRHGAKRVKERIGLGKGSIQKNAEKALSFGITHAETKGSLHRYLDGVYLLKECSNNMRVYNRMVYLFRGNVLITVLPLPQKYLACADKLQKNKKVEDL